jgi:tetratricopeptide (TPR) repeat protein
VKTLLSLLVLCFVLLSASITYAQRAVEDTTRLSTFVDSADKIYTVDLEGAYDLWTRGEYLSASLLELSAEKAFTAVVLNQHAEVLANIGYYHSAKGQFQWSHDYYHRAEQIRLQMGDTLGLASVNNSLGFLYKKHGIGDTALQDYEMALSFRVAVNDSGRMALTYNNLGALFNDQGTLLFLGVVGRG